VKLSIIAAAAAAFMTVAASGASALPTAKPSQMGVETAATVEQVRHDRRHYRGDRHYRGNRGLHRGWRHNRHHNRYDRYRGWNRYSYRPRGWRERGCVSVGPVWFCR
jgi:hypothetical protein